MKAFEKKKKKHIYLTHIVVYHYLHILEQSKSNSITGTILYLSFVKFSEYGHLSHNNLCFQYNTAITNFLASHTCEIRFHDVISQSTVPMYLYTKIPNDGWPTWRNEYVLEPYCLIQFVGFSYVIKRI